MELSDAIIHLETSLLMGVDYIPVAQHLASAQEVDACDQLEQLRSAHDETCPHCTQATGYTQTVFGTGNPNARLMFIGEAPGVEEDRCGIPFVGDAGKKLDEMITAMGLVRKDVYIANVLKCRPPNNRTPSPEEVALCGPFLQLQIKIIKPHVIVTLGSPAAKYLLETTIGITKLRGNWSQFSGIPVMPTFHPAYLLRNYTKEIRGFVWSDMQQVMAKLT